MEKLKELSMGLLIAIAAFAAAAVALGYEIILSMGESH
jgi:hypothetical protein